MEGDKNMMRHAIHFIITFILVAGCSIFSKAPVNAAQKKTVYVVETINFKQGKETTKTKLTYNKNGTIKIIKDSREKETMTFSYGKNGQIKNFKDKIEIGDHKGTETRKYTWKNGNIEKMFVKRFGDSTATYTFKYKKGMLDSSTNVEQWTGDDGSPQSNVIKTTYTMKKGHIYKMKNKYGTFSQKMDKKGNVVQIGKKTGGFGGYYIAKITYKKNRISKMKIESWNPMMTNKNIRGDNALKGTKVITYKTIKVNKSLADIIEAQQWKLLNGTATEDFAW